MSARDGKAASLLWFHRAVRPRFCRSARAHLGLITYRSLPVGDCRFERLWKAGHDEDRPRGCVVDVDRYENLMSWTRTVLYTRQVVRGVGAELMAHNRSAPSDWLSCQTSRLYPNMSSVGSRPAVVPNSRCDRARASWCQPRRGPWTMLPVKMNEAHIIVCR